ncbi:MAG: SMC-Scp complex subunit ScpB [Gemmatimonadota bacterium]|nr:MAG: SMC-Scp complex subunit ScpB [Gemmatimonadota bacterium]
MNRLTQLVEAALFSADSPLSLSELATLDRDASRADFQEALEELRQQYHAAGHGIELTELAEGYQILTRREFADAIAQAHLVTRPRRLSAAALETLAIIAYRQPVGRAEVEEIRGVSVEGVLRSLQERGLVDVVGRAEGLGRPLLYGTTTAFLELLGLAGLEHLPRIDELSVALRSPVEPGEAGE